MTTETRASTTLLAARMTDKEILEEVKAALTDPNLSDGAKVYAALSYLGGLVEPTPEDIAWALKAFSGERGRV